MLIKNLYGPYLLKYLVLENIHDPATILPLYTVLDARSIQHKI